MTAAARDGRHPPVADDDTSASDPDDERRLARYVGRPLLFVFWTLVVWGTVYAVLFAFAVVTDGPGDALARATTGPDRAFGIANLTLASVAILVWITVGVAVARVRSPRDTVEDEPREDSL